MAKSPRTRVAEIQFPILGVNRSPGYQRHSGPYTCYDATNVFPRGVVEGRARGGSRPGTMQHVWLSGRSSAINMIAPLSYTYDGGYESESWDLRRLKSDTLPKEWTEVSGTKYHLDWPRGISAMSGTAYKWKEEISGLANGTAYWICVRAIMSVGAVVKIYAEQDSSLAGDCVWTFTMSGTTPFDVVTTDPASNDTTESDVAPTRKPVWLCVKVDGNDSYGYVDGSSVDSDDSWTGAGDYWGVEISHGTTGEYVTVDQVRLVYTPTSTTNRVVDTIVYAHNGSLWYDGESTPLTAGQVSSTVSLDSSNTLAGAQYQGKLYVADRGAPLFDNGGTTHVGNPDILYYDSKYWMRAWSTGIVGSDTQYADLSGYGIDPEDHILHIETLEHHDAEAVIRFTDPVNIATWGANNGSNNIVQINAVDLPTATLAQLTAPNDTASISGDNWEWEVVRCAKFYDPEATTPIAKLLYDGCNSNYPPPIGCKLMATFAGCLVQAAPARWPHKIYISNFDDPRTYDYAGALSDVDDPQRAWADDDGIGGGGRPITAIANYYDTFFLIWNATQTYILDEHPHLGGSMRMMSNQHGCVGMNAWTVTPNGEILFLASDGLCWMSGANPPTLVSRDRIPDALIGCHKDSILAWDGIHGGVLIFTPYQGYWFWHHESASYWEIHFPSSWQVTSAHTTSDGIAVLGFSNGQIRYLDDASDYDDDTAVDSSVTIGPLKAGESLNDGLVNSLDITLGEDCSDTVTWRVFTADAAEGAISQSETNSNAFASGSLSVGRNNTVRPRMRGFAWALKLTASSQWTYEACQAVLQTRGRHRAL